MGELCDHSLITDVFLVLGIKSVIFSTHTHRLYVPDIQYLTDSGHVQDSGIIGGHMQQDR